MVRSGDEPLHARSPLRMRLGLAVIGMLVAVAIASWSWVAGWEPGVVLAAAVALGAGVNVVVVAAHLRSGPHFQPRRDIPPYRPAETPRRPPPRDGEVAERVRLRWYLILMAICVGLITLAWLWVRLFSAPLAIGMSLVAMVIPPLAAILANAGWSGRGR